MSLSLNDKENKILIVEDIIKKRKDPKTMSVEELEEYISKNKSKFKEGGISSIINNSNKSLNSSMNSQKILNRSYTAGKNNMHNNLANQIHHIKSPSTENTPEFFITPKIKENFGVGNKNFTNKENNFISENSQENIYLNNYRKMDKNINSEMELAKTKYANSHSNTSINPFLNNLPSSKQNYSCQFNENLSDNEENRFNKNEHITILRDDGNLNRNHSLSGIPTNSTAGNNYLKSLQEKIISLQKENDELKKNFINISEILEKERTEFQKKIINEINKGNEVEKSLKQEMSSMTQENKELLKELNEVKEKMTVLNTNLSLVEKEKGRHLEQNAIEKENLNIQIEKFVKENEELKKVISKIEGDNHILRDSLKKFHEDFKETEKNLSKLKSENISIKQEYKEKINEYNKDIEKAKSQFDAERDELLENIKALKNIVKQLDTEKTDLAKKYEKNLKELTVKMNRLERNNPNSNELKINLISSSSNKNPSFNQPKSKEKVKKYSTNISLNKEKKQITKELNISNNRTNKLQRSKNTKSPIDKMLNTNYGSNNSSRIDRSSSKKSTKSQSKSSAKISNNLISHQIENTGKDNLNLKVSQISLLSGLGQNSLGFLSPVQTNFSLENISAMNTNILNYFPDNNTKNEEMKMMLFNNKEEIERNNYLNVINNSIFELERSIADLNRSYKNLMIKLNTPLNSEEASYIKRNINSIANNLQEQSERLMELKTKQQELLKTSTKINKY